MRIQTLHPNHYGRFGNLYSLRFKTGSVFPLHNYYVIPFVPLMALMAGYGMNKLRKAYRIVCIALICVEGIANQ
jgi:hypothetical protein